MKKSKQTVALTILLLLATMFMGQEARGFSFSEDFEKGFYWASFPLGLQKFVTNPADGPLLAELAHEAQLDWEDALGASIWDGNENFQVTNSTAGNHIRWSFNFGEETGFDPSRTLAITVRHRVGTHFTRFEIILNGENQSMRLNTNNLLKKTLLHELGHTLGLDHSNQPSIMQANVGSISTLQEDDIEGGQAILAQHFDRQSTGFISPFAFSENGADGAGCGSVAVISLSKRGGGGPGSFLGSFAMGFLLLVLLCAGRKSSQLVGNWGKSSSRAAI